MMKQVFAVVAAMLFLVGCIKKDSGNPVASTPPAPASVTFAMHLESGSQGMIFVAKPSADVKLSKVEVSFPAGQFSDTIVNPQPDRVFPKAVSIPLNEYSGIETHQQWVLKFTGTVVSTGQSFTVTVNWDVV